MQELIAALVHFFLIEPLGAELAERLAGARVPQDVVREVVSCLRTESGAVIDKATSDLPWTITRGLGIWTGMVQPEDVLVEAAPGCAQALAGARGALAS